MIRPYQSIEKAGTGMQQPNEFGDIPVITVSSTRRGVQRKHTPSSDIDTVSSRSAPAQRKHKTIVQFILDWFGRDSTAALTTADIAMPWYRISQCEIRKKHRVAVIRAMKTVNAKNPQLRIYNGEGPEGQLIIFDSHNITSYALAMLKDDSFSQYQWSRYGWWIKPKKERELRNRLRKDERYQELVKEGGSWWRHVEQYKAEDSGDRLSYLKYDRENVKTLYEMTVGFGGDASNYAERLDAIDTEIKELETA